MNAIVVVECNYKYEWTITCMNYIYLGKNIASVNLGTE